MMKSNMTALTLAGILSLSSLAALAESSGGTPPVDKGGMPPPQKWRPAPTPVPTVTPCPRAP